MTRILQEDLLHQLGELKDLLHQLTKLIQEERVSVVEMNLSTLSEHHKNKVILLHKIQEVEKKKNATLQDIALEYGINQTESITSIIEAVPNNEWRMNIRDRLSMVRSLAQAIKELTSVEQRVIQHSLEEVRRSLKLIDVKMARPESAAYNASGKESHKQAQRSTLSTSV